MSQPLTTPKIANMGDALSLDILHTCSVMQLVGLIHPKDHAIENYTRISDKFASGVGCDVMVCRGLSIVSRTFSLRHAS